MTRRAVLMASVILVTLGVFVPRASTAGDNPLIAQGIQEYNDLLYEDSVNTLSAALMRPGNTDDQLIEIYKYLGLDYLLLDKPDEAAGAFVKLLCIDEEWGFDPATTSPKITTFFDEVKNNWIAEGKPGQETDEVGPQVTIQHKVPDQGVSAEATNLKMVIADPQMQVVNVIVRYKVDEGWGFVKAMPSAPPGAETIYMATIPEEAAIPPNVDYYIQAVDATGNVLAQRGDTDAPLRIPIPTEEKTSVAKKWWFWTIIGVVVLGVAGGVAGGVIASQDGGGGSGTAGVSIIICEPGVDC